MMKKIFAVLLLCVSIINLVGCSGNVSESDSEFIINEDVEVEEKDFLESYIKNLEDANKMNFYNFWNEMKFYCSSLEYELRAIGNENSYEFNPMEDGTVPEELKDVFNFAKIKYNVEVSKHSGYLLKIDGENVEFHFDGYCFYPTERTSTEVQRIAEKYTVE